MTLNTDFKAVNKLEVQQASMQCTGIEEPVYAAQVDTISTGLEQIYHTMPALHAPAVVEQMHGCQSCQGSMSFPARK